MHASEQAWIIWLRGVLSALQMTSPPQTELEFSDRARRFYAECAGSHDAFESNGLESPSSDLLCPPLPQQIRGALKSIRTHTGFLRIVRITLDSAQTCVVAIATTPLGSISSLPCCT